MRDGARDTVRSPQPGVGMSAPSSPCCRRSAQSWGGISTSNRDRSVSSSLIVRGPTSTVHTRGCASGNWMAAAAKGDVVLVADLPDGPRLGDERVIGGQVIEERAGNRIDQDAAVEDAADHDRDAATFA